MSFKDFLKSFNQVVAVGSIDGVCTTAGLLRATGRFDEIRIEFTQAFQVDKVDPTEWEPNRKVVFVDLAVNNRDPQMTADFVRRVREAGHEIMGVIDEHDDEAWLKIMVSFDDLAIWPVTKVYLGGQAFESSGAILLRSLERQAEYESNAIDNHTRELCEAADAGDRMDFSTHFGGLVNKAVKSAIWDNTRRVYLVKHFARSYEPDKKIMAWITEYENILRIHNQVIEAREYLGDGIIRIDCTGKTVDMTTLMGQAYNQPGVKVCIVRGEMFNPAEKTKEIMSAFGTRIKDFNILSVIKASGIPVSGFASKANVELEYEEVALTAVRNALSS